MMSPSRDFESRASANSTTPAKAIYLIYYAIIRQLIKKIKRFYSRKAKKKEEKLKIQGEELIFLRKRDIIQLLLKK